jgi:N-methylhydantoinase A
MIMKRIGVDIGGTFTDIVYFDDNSMEVIIDKVRSTPQDVGQAVVTVIEKIKVDLPGINQFIHGTTVGLNALLERKGSKTALITTKGFTDILEMARGNSKELYNFLWRKPKPLVPRYLRMGVTERMDYRGQVLTELNEKELHDIIDTLKKNGVEAIAVSLLHSYVNPENEKKIEKIVKAIWPEVVISLSHQIAREYREYERTSTTVIDAYTKKKVVKYLELLTQRFNSRGFKGQILIAGSGGVIGVKAAENNSLYTMSSGPTGGAVASARLANLTGNKNLMIMDVGGTSFDVAVIKDGTNIERYESEWMGLPVLMQSIDIRSIGAGGGSIARVDEGGLLIVGPESAGANPGPMCYDTGGTKPTVTDAALVNGIINPLNFIGGDYTLNIDLARKGVGEIAAKLGISLNKAADGILAVARNNMTIASSEILIGQGYDPRDFAMLAYGGGGGIFAEGIAKDMKISRVIVPPYPGVFCAWGMLCMDVVHTFSQTFNKLLSAINFKDVEDVYREMKTRALEMLKDEKIPADSVKFICSLDMCYAGQGHYVEVPLSGSDSIQQSREEISELFHKLHEIKYGHRLESPVRITNVRMKAVGILKKVPVKEIESGNIIPVSAVKPARKVFLDGSFIDCQIYNREKLLCGNVIHGPAIIEEPHHTTIVAVGQTLTIDKWGNLVIDIRGA